MILLIQKLKNLKNKETHIKNITYTGDLTDLVTLLDENGKVDENKLLDWLENSKNLEYGNKVRKKSGV